MSNPFTRKRKVRSPRGGAPRPPQNHFPETPVGPRTFRTDGPLGPVTVERTNPASRPTTLTVFGRVGTEWEAGNDETRSQRESPVNYSSGVEVPRRLFSSVELPLVSRTRPSLRFRPCTVGPRLDPSTTSPPQAGDGGTLVERGSVSDTIHEVDTEQVSSVVGDVSILLTPGPLRRRGSVSDQRQRVGVGGPPGRGWETV